MSIYVSEKYFQKCKTNTPLDLFCITINEVLIWDPLRIMKSERQVHHQNWVSNI